MGGKDNTFIGTGIPEALKNGSGNTVISDPSFLMGRGGLAVGAGAKADAASVAIGANAGAGVGVTQVDFRVELVKAIAPLIADENGVSDELKKSALALLQEIQKAKPDKGSLEMLWKSFAALATVDGVVGISEKVKQLIWG